MLPKTKIFLFAVVLACAICGDQDARSMDLNQFQWKNRLLFIFAPQDGDPFFRTLQIQISDHHSELSERDLVVFKIFESGPSFMATTRIASQTAAALRNRFDAPPKRFTCILVGKDGGVKFRRSTPVNLKEIFDLIDAMPMRREEIRQKGQSDELK